MVTTAASVEMEQGSVSFELVDDDDEPLTTKSTYEWSGRDPLELVIYAVTELSGRPWKWSSRKGPHAKLSAPKCRALSIRTGRCLRRDQRARTAAVIARVIAVETFRPGKPAPDAKEIAALLAGSREPDWDAGPTETVPAMLRALRKALKSAVEADAGLSVVWGEDDA